MEQEDDMFPPFWLQTSDHSLSQANRRGRRLGSIFFSSGTFVLVLLAIALVFIFFIIPSLLSFTSQIFKPHLVKKSWDSLNLVLVLFAIVCGFLGRNGSQENSISSPSAYDQAHHQTAFNAPIAAQDIQKSNPSTPRQWYDHDQYADRTAYIDQSANTMHRGVRASSSYPDLRQQEALWVAGDDRWRFFDDTHVASLRVSGSEQLRHHHRRHRSWHEEPVHLPAQQEADHVPTKNIPVDTFVIRTQIPDAQSAPPPRSPPQPLKAKRMYQAVGEKEKSAADDNLEVVKKLPPPPARPPPSPPSPQPLPPRSTEAESKRSAGKNVKKRGVATTKEFLITSLRRKKKKQRQKSVENFETLIGSSSSAPSSSSLLPPPSPPPPPPPLPPPPSEFHNLFSTKKSNKPNKTIHSIPQTPSPITSTALLSKSKAQIRPTMTTQKPPLPVRLSNYNNVDDENSNSGGESPLVRIPPPPPLPPFRMPAMKFVVHGDFVRIKSNNSSRSGSPDLDDDDDQDSVSSPTMEGGGAGSTPPLESGESPKAAMFCPSPDVNTKAETFIARVRAGLRLEKMNSVKEKQGRKSNLGPGSREGEGDGPSY